MNSEGGVGFDYEIFENGVWEWGIEEKQGMSRYDYVQCRWSAHNGLYEKQKGRRRERTSHDRRTRDH